MFPICVECLSRLCSRIATAKSQSMYVNMLATFLKVQRFDHTILFGISIYYAGNEWLNWQILTEPSETLKGEVILYILNSLMILLIGT